MDLGDPSVPPSGRPRLSGPVDRDLRVLVTRRTTNGGAVWAAGWDGSSWNDCGSMEAFPGMVEPATVSRHRVRRTRTAIGRAADAVLGTLVAAVIVLVVSQASGLVTVRSVLTGSMEPSIPTGSIVVAVNDSVRSPREGDVVLYLGRRFDGSAVGTFAHRIVGGSAAEGWIVQGDANPFPDTQRAFSADIAAVVVGSAPGLGRLASARSLVLVVLLATGAWLLASGLWSR